MAKIKKRSKQRHHSKEKGTTPPAAATIGVDPLQGGTDPTSSINGDSIKHTSETDTLISQLHDHLDQGRIFDARSTVQKLHALESKDPTSSPKLKPVRHLMEEVVTQSDHVESLLHELHSDDDWTLAKQKSGVTVHYRREPSSPIHTVRAVTTFDNFSPKDFVRLCSLFVETECMHLWFPGGVMKKANLLSWHSKYSKVIQLRISLGLPMVSSRDAIVLGNGYHLPDRNAFLISTKTILDDTCRYCDIPTPGKGIVRMATESIFYLELVKSDVISFKMIGRDDLKLKYMPSTLLNYLSQGHLPFDLMKTIHRTIRNFEGSVWEKKIEERGAYYTEIEDKVHEQLEKWEKDGGGNGKSLDMQIEEKRSENMNVKYYTENEGLNQVFVTGENESQAKEQHYFTVLAIVAALSTSIASVLYYMAFPDTLPILAPTVLHDLSEELRGLSALLLAIIIVSLLLPVMMLISLLVGVKLPHKNYDVTDNEQSIMTDDGGVNKPRTAGSGYDEFLSFGNADQEDEDADPKTEHVGLNNPKAGGNGKFISFINSDPKTEAAPGELDQSNRPNKDSSSPNNRDDITNIGEALPAEITSSPHPSQSGGSHELKPSIRSSSKLRKVRSNLNTGLREMKKVASLRVASGKRDAPK
mmetsp:Transcript_3855/g.6941  ORF Transcript_3855/g.6941 Transcript_3855/m.6941 type:complete len:642 (+) Transcript_3855:71-1996(+)